MAEDNVAKKAVAKKAPVKRAAKKVAPKVEQDALDVLLEAVKVARENGVVVQGAAVLLTDNVTRERNL